MRLKKEFDEAYKKRTANISVSLKPVVYRNRDVGIGEINSDDEKK